MHRAWDNVLEREVALKLVRADLPAGSEGRSRLLREARLAANLSHPNICVVHDVGEMDGRPFVTMELLRGETLRHRLSRSRTLSLDDTIRVGRDVAAALGEAHRQGVVHRDIKPENIMILPDGRVKVLDFGLAKVVDGLDDSAAVTEFSPSQAPTNIDPRQSPTMPISPASLTSPGTILGTYHYLSPEQASAAPVDARSDIFSFGVVLYEMLSGRHPFDATSYPDLLEVIRTQDPPSLPGLRPDAPAAVTGVVERCLRKKPEDRYADGRELTSALESAGAPRRTWQRAAAPWVGVALATIALLTGLWWAGLLGIVESPGPAPLPLVTQVTFDGAWLPQLSPDGSMLAYAMRRDGVNVAMVQSTSGGAPREIYEGEGRIMTECWKADGTAILGRLVTDEGVQGIWEVPIFGGKPHPLVVSGGVGFPDYHPTQARIAYASYSDGRGRIVSRDLVSEEELTLYESEEHESCYKPRWSPDGHQLVYECFDYGAGRTLLYLTDESGQTRIPFELEDLHPTGMFHWAPDGRKIVIGAKQGSRTNLWFVPIPGEDLPPRRLTMGTRFESFPTIDPTGTKIFYVGEETDTEVILVDPRTGNLRESVLPFKGASNPAFWPDGEGLVLSQLRNGVGVVLSHSLSGEPPVVLSESTGQSCDAPFPLGNEEVAFVCEDHYPEGQGASQSTEEWVRTVFVASREGGRARRLFQFDGEVELAASSPSGDRILAAFVRKDGDEIRIVDRASGEQRKI